VFLLPCHTVTLLEAELYDEKHFSDNEIKAGDLFFSKSLLAIDQGLDKAVKHPIFCPSRFHIVPLFLWDQSRYKLKEKTTNVPLSHLDYRINYVGWDETNM